jgi:DNA-binding MarR family transcriptional regulator
MKKTAKFDFASEMSRMMPLLLREVTKRQEGILVKGDLVVSHIIVLDLISEKGPCTMGDLARSMNLTMSAVTGIVDAMVKKGLVKRERSRKDRRVVKVAFLKKGENTVKHVNEQRSNMTSELYSVFNEKERNEYLRLIRKVYNGLVKK